MINVSSADTNPYQPPLSRDVSDRDDNAPDRTWHWWSVLLLGVSAGGTSILCTIVYSNSTGEMSNAPTAQISLLTHYLRIGTFYIAGLMLALGFVLMTRQVHRNLRDIAILSTLAVVAQLGAEVTAITLSAAGLPGVMLNMLLRSTFLICLINWFTDTPIRRLRLALIVVVGTLLWIVLFALLGFLGFTFCWSIVAAFQLWLSHTPRLPLAYSPTTNRSDFLPKEVELDL